jgi:hypothetical protein
MSLKFIKLYSNTCKSCYLSLLYLLIATLSYATTVAPPRHLGALANMSDELVLIKMIEKSQEFIGSKEKTAFKFEVIDHLKGTLKLHEYIQLTTYGFTEGDTEFKVIGDLDFELNKSYLVFLDKHENRFRPQMMAYGIFELVHYENKEYFIPLMNSEAMTVNQDSDFNILAAYKKKELYYSINKFLKDNKSWNQNSTLSEYTVDQLRGISQAAPSHCSYLTGGNGKSGFRWQNFETAPVNIRYSSTLDMYFSGCNTQAVNAINDLKSNYTGTNLLNGGTHAYIPNCAQNSAVSGNFLNYINSTYGSSRNTLIIYNDPCDEIPNLVSCFGVLAFGGMYGSSCHSYDGLNWYNAGYGYVVVNDSVGACYSANSYKLILTHELTHSLGIGHISSSFGNANMNPFCCKVISALDIDCVNYLYLPNPTPIRLEYFKAIATQASAQLNWATATEFNNSHFEIEKSTDGSNFKIIGNVKGNSNSVNRIIYSFIDPNISDNKNYYRLKQVDFDGKYSYSNIEVLEIKNHNKEIQIYNDPFSKTITIDQPDSDELLLEIEVLDVAGKTILSSNKLNLNKSKYTLNYNNKISSGNYFCKLKYYKSTHYIKIQIAE